MKVLFAVWELDPFFKIGGLGDVARALPGALKKLEVDIRVIVPYYKVVKFRRNKKTKVGEFKIDYAGRKQTVEIWEVIHPYTKFPAYFLKNQKYLDKIIGIDTWGFFDKAVVEIVKSNILNWKPDLVHVNDSHCGLIPRLIKAEKLPVKVMLTIHNLAYQKKTSLAVIKHMGVDLNFEKSIPWETKKYQINFLLEAIMYADIITTVSPTYAKEILTEEFGDGLNEILKGMEEKIFGILNGIDIDTNYMVHDPGVRFPYNPGTWKEGKKLNKQFLQRKLGLKVDPNIPLLCYIGRIDARQKGLDILHTMLRRVKSPDFEFVVLGSGNEDWEERYKWLSAFYPKFISCNFKYEDDFAHQLYAASDFIVIPSKYEPCGLIQMIAMLFGTIPIAHNTGGLSDSIREGENGFLFSKYDSEGLEEKVRTAVKIWKSDKQKIEKMVENAFVTDFSWDKSAEEYLALYKKLLNEKV